MAQKYADWIESKQAASIGTRFLKVGRTNCVLVTDELYAWITTEREWNKVMKMAVDEPTDSADTYTAMCGLIEYRRDLIPQFEKEYGARQWA